jgi:class 3 adenylate cyclase
MEEFYGAGAAHYRTIIALDIEQSTRRTDPVKAELRDKLYELFDQALRSAGIHPRHRDPFIDRGDGILALIHPVRQAPKAVLLNLVIPALRRLLADYNADLPQPALDYQLRARLVVHAGEVRYDSHGCFGEALDIAFRLLDHARVKNALRAGADPLALVISGDIYRSVVRHGDEKTDLRPFESLGHVRVAGYRHPGWIQAPGIVVRRQLIDIAGYRKTA